MVAVVSSRWFRLKRRFVKGVESGQQQKKRRKPKRTFRATLHEPEGDLALRVSSILLVVLLLLLLLLLCL